MLFNESKSRCDVKQTKVVSGEKGKFHRVENKSKSPIYQYHIDGDIIRDIKVQKCDYIVEVTKEKPIAFIIELKGSHLSEACNQIENTVDYFKILLKPYDIRPRIIIKKVNTHAVNDSKYRSFKKNYPKMELATNEYTDIV